MEGHKGGAETRGSQPLLYNAFAIRHSTKISNRLCLPKGKMKIIYMTRVSYSLFPQ